MSQIILPGSTLEGSLDYLEVLDESRQQFAKWRNEGRRALMWFLENRDTKKTVEWADELDVRSRAAVITALTSERNDIPESLIASEVKHLGETTIGDILSSGTHSVLFDVESGDTPFLDAASGLTALAGAPRGAIARATMYFYYVVVRELYYAAPPTWVVGGGRAGPGGFASAFVTAQLVEGVLSFIRMLQRTGTYVDAIADLFDQSQVPIPAWQKVDTARWRLATFTRLSEASSNIAFPLEHPLPDRGTDGGFDLEKFMKVVRESVPAALDHAVGVFEAAVASVEEYRHAEAKAAKNRTTLSLLARSEGAHDIAKGALEDAARRAAEARKAIKEAAGKSDHVFAKALRNLKKQFDDAAEAASKLLQPAGGFAAAVLDRELATLTAGAGGATAFEPAEMAAAAAAYGAATSRWDDERLGRVAIALAESVTDRGFPVGRPFHNGEGTFWQPSQPQIMLYFGYLVQHVRTPLPAPAVRRIERYFAETRRAVEGEKAASWRWEYGSNLKRSPFNTAAATLALARLNRMLDSRINDMVLDHFVWRVPRAPKLHELFYPDFGLVNEPKCDRAESIAVTLERMHAHVAGTNIGSDPVYSLVLHGPPGTGKTTIVEALAASAGARLVEVTPSDIVLRGADAIEERARAVLRALSLLTKTVVLFDEFERVLRSRAGNASSSTTTTFDFLAGGMLPKLKKLYDTAGRRRVAYVLATNYLGAIDPAAVREGRFDRTVGIYPPDLVSRAGRLWSEMRAFCRVTGCEFTVSDLYDRVAEVLRATANASMPRLTRRGWFLRPKGLAEVPETSPFGYFLAVVKSTMPPESLTPADADQMTEGMLDEERRAYDLSMRLDREHDSEDSRHAWEVFRAAFLQLDPKNSN